MTAGCHRGTNSTPPAVPIIAIAGLSLLILGIATITTYTIRHNLVLLITGGITSIVTTWVVVLVGIIARGTHGQHRRSRWSVW